jgi:hypothetical protein
MVWREATMATRYVQNTGRLSVPAYGDVPEQTFQCHAGQGEGLNNPRMQNVAMKGPLCVGKYHFGPFQDGSAYGPSFARLGKFISRLTPEEGTQLFGRKDFCFHGGANPPTVPPTDSEGCIVTDHVARQAVADYIAATGDDELEVVSGLEDQAPENQVADQAPEPDANDAGTADA